MSSELRRRYTLEEYFTLESSSDEKYEYFEGEVFAMSGASLAHEQIVANVIVSLRNSLRGRPCRVPSNARLKAPSLPLSGCYGPVWRTADRIDRRHRRVGESGIDCRNTLECDGSLRPRR